jgi:hypothetical protein
MLRLILRISVTASLVAALLTPSGASAHGGNCPTVNGTALATLSSGEIKSWPTFSDSDGNGVPNGFLADDDFSGNHCERNLSSDGEVHRSVLYDETSNGNCCGAGDLSIYRLHSASAGQTYYAGATMNLWNTGGDFRGVIKISAFSTPEDCLIVSGGCWERIAKICVSSAYAACDAYDDSNYKSIAVSGTLPTGTNYVKFVFRGRRAQTDAYGTVGKERVWYCRSC